MLRVHAYRFFKLFSAAALLALFALPQSEAHQCSDLFVGGLSSPWTQPYLAARHEGQTDREMYALLQMTLQSAKKLGLTSQEKIAVKSAILEIEMEALDHEYQERGKPAQFALAFKKFFGLTSGTFSARNGIPYDIAYSFLPIAALAKHVVYKFNPLLIWNLQEILLKSAEQHHLASAIANAEKIPEFIAEGEIKTHASVFADKVQNGESRRTWQLGRLAMPWITSLALFATVGGGPYSIVKDVARTTLVPYEQSLYHDTEFFRDTRTHVANFSAGRVLVAYLDTFARIDSRERPPLALRGVYEISKNQALDVLKIATLNDLGTTDLSRYDNVIVLAHGSAGSSPVFLDETKSYQKLKPGANLIFLSCLVGQAGTKSKDPMSEPWVRTAARMLDGGKAVAATQIITTRLTPENAGKSTNQAFEKTDILVNYGAYYVAETTGILQFVDVVDAALSFGNKYYIEPKGIRIYDSKTNKVTYYPSEKPKKN